MKYLFQFAFRSKAFFVFIVIFYYYDKKAFCWIGVLILWFLKCFLYISKFY